MGCIVQGNSRVKCCEMPFIASRRNSNFFGAFSLPKKVAIRAFVFPTIHKSNVSGESEP